MSADEAARQAHIEVFGTDPVASKHITDFSEHNRILQEAAGLERRFIERTRRQVAVSDRLMAQRDAILAVALEMLNNEIPGSIYEEYEAKLNKAKEAGDAEHGEQAGEEAGPGGS